MNEDMLSLPRGEGCPAVLVCGFKRSNCLAAVMAAVRAARPSQLFLALDFPRDGHPSDHPGWEACKKVFEAIDWPCEVFRNYAERNMGCGERIQSAITWMFSHVDRAIILEDDCVPHPTFFRFCAELLERYKDDTRVGMIAGHDEHLHMDRIETYGDSYYFDRMTTIGGWATWRRAWDKYDSEMKDWPFMAETRILRNVFPRNYHVTDWIDYSGRLYRGERKTWAGKWAMAMYREHWLSVHPNRNLVSHIGTVSSREEDSGIASDISRVGSPFDNRPVYAMNFPLQHPRTMIPNTRSEFWHMEDVHTCHWWRHIPTSPADFVRKWRKLMRRLSSK